MAYFAGVAYRTQIRRQVGAGILLASSLTT